MSPTRRLSTADVACWLLKSATLPPATPAGWAPGTTRRLRRCVRPSYRLSLMAPGQPCVLWLSGRVDPGVQAVGALTSSPVVEVAGEEAVEVELRRVRRGVPRADLVDDPAFRGAEVVRMAAGSNPSYLTHAQLGAVVELLGEEAGALATVSAAGAGGWSG
ncbi:hypothetical protein GTR02_03315 [Kineococcus sp. R8]|uniref:hypothetical protein n=1 Tax=Kineococcus siccus TaxID=2696567 RepID=UPI001412F7F0|nr:hypothetical protein [Kineococcus siccus]NAZ80847.1 hypothetical protein [Kineococcus siccus]